MEYAIPVICFLIGAGLGYLMLRAKARGLFWGAAAVLAIAVAWQWWAAQTAPSGWDGIAVMILVMMFLMPGLVGLLTGGWFAWWKARRAAARERG